MVFNSLNNIGIKETYFHLSVIQWELTVTSGYIFKENLRLFLCPRPEVRFPQGHLCLFDPLWIGVHSQKQTLNFALL